MKKIQKLLGEMFVEKGLVTEEQVQIVVQEQLQAQSRKFIGEMFVEQGLATEDDLVVILAKQFSIDYVKLASEEIDWDAPAVFSSSFINTHKCLPLWMGEESIRVVITNPLNVWLVDTVEREAAPNKVEIVLAKESDMDAAIKEFKKHALRKMMDKFKKD